eukprot:1093353-Pelagomonas_calceolata.AAC.5
MNKAIPCSWRGSSVGSCISSVSSSQWKAQWGAASQLLEGRGGVPFCPPQAGLWVCPQAWAHNLDVAPALRTCVNVLMYSSNAHVLAGSMPGRSPGFSAPRSFVLCAGSMPRRGPSITARPTAGSAATSPTAPSHNNKAVADLSAHLNDVSLRADGLEKEKEL